MRRPVRLVSRTAIIIAASSVAFAIPLGAQGSASAEPLILAGVGYLSRDADIDAHFRLTRAVERAAAASGTDLTARFGRELLSAGVAVTTGLSPRPGVALALAFDGESVSSEQLAGSWKIIVNISAQVLTFDFAESQALSAFPVSFEWIDNRPVKPDDAYYSSLTAPLLALFDAPAGQTLIRNAVAALKRMPLRAAARCRVRLMPVVVDSSVQRISGGRFSEANGVGAAIATIFGRSWVTAAQMPLLPYAGSQVVNGKMVAQFSDGRVYDIKIPEADFVISLDTVRVVRKTVTSSVAERGDAVRAYATIRVSEPLSGSTIALVSDKDALLDRVPVLQTTVDEWAPGLNAFESLFLGVAQAARKGDREWFKKHAVNPTDEAAGLTLSKWVTKCAP